MEKGGGKTANNDQNFLTNFIGDSILENDLPRAFSVTKTGEKHLLDLDETLTEKNSASNLLPFVSSRYSIAEMERISEKSSQLSQMEDANKSSNKVKKFKSVKRFTCPKYNLKFSPRNSKLSNLKIDQVKIKEINNRSKCRSQETQTDKHTNLNLFMPTVDNHFSPLTYGYNIPSEGLITYKKKSLQRQPNLLNFDMSTSLKPPIVHRRREQNWEKYSVLCTIISALTLMTMIYLLFLIYFDGIVFWEYFYVLWDYSQKWFLEKEEEKKTKVELFVAFLQDLWS